VNSNGTTSFPLRAAAATFFEDEVYTAEDKYPKEKTSKKGEAQQKIKPNNVHSKLRSKPALSR